MFHPPKWKFSVWIPAHTHTLNCTNCHVLCHYQNELLRASYTLNPSPNTHPHPASCLVLPHPAIISNSLLVISDELHIFTLLVHLLEGFIELLELVFIYLGQIYCIGVVKESFLPITHTQTNKQTHRHKQLLNPEITQYSKYDWFYQEYTLA